MIPPLVAIIIAMLTRRIIVALLAGLWMGSFIVSPGVFTSLSKMTHYIVETISQPGNMNVLLFMYAFSGLVALIQKSGGVEGFSRWVEQYAKGKKGTLIWVWILAPITFIDCAFRVIATGSILKNNIKKEGIDKRKFAFMLNNSASPIVALIPLGTAFVGYMVGVVASGLNIIDSNQSAYMMFVKSIPYNLFSIASFLVIILYFLNILRFKDHKLDQADSNPKEDRNASNEENKEKESSSKPNLWNLIIPIVILIPLSAYLMYWTGKEKGSNLVTIFSNTNASHSILVALVTTILVTAVLYRLQDISTKEMIKEFISGGNKIMKTIIILTLAWPIAVVSKELGLSDLITNTLAGHLPAFIVPSLIFIITSLVAFFMGSSWGSWALMMPLSIPLASVSEAGIPIAVGAVFAGGTFGDVSSPLSGMVAMASGVADVNLLDYVKYELPYNIVAAVLATIGFLIIPLIG